MKRKKHNFKQSLAIVEEQLNLADKTLSICATQSPKKWELILTHLPQDRNLLVAVNSYLTWIQTF